MGAREAGQLRVEGRYVSSMLRRLGGCKVDWAVKSGG